MRVGAVLAAVAGLFLFSAPLAAAGQQDQGQGVIKVTICHATASFTNPYTNPSVDLDAVDGVGNNDHSSHTGHVFDGATKGWGDIIPPVADDGITPVPGGGLNFDEAGQAIHENGCVIPPPEEPPVEPLEPDLSASEATCTDESDGGVLVTITNAGTGGDDVTVTEVGGFDSGLVAVGAGDTETVLVPIDEDAAYDISVVDGAAASVPDAPFVGTLDCVEVLVEEEENEPDPDPKPQVQAETNDTTPPTVLGVSATNDQLPVTGIEGEAAAVAMALLLLGAVALGLGQHIAHRPASAGGSGVVRGGAAPRAHDLDLPGDERLRRGDAPTTIDG